jgi:ATP-dependent Clp protease ATP-binding subunit ClpB
MTSNVGSDAIQQYAGRDEARMKDLAMEALRRSFRPEFLNRIDEIVFFKALGEEQIVGILDLQLRNLEKLLEERNLRLYVTDAAKHFLAREGYDPVYGARPLKRTIQREIQNPLASAILRGEFKAGDTVRVDATEAGISFAKDAGESAEATVH